MRMKTKTPYASPERIAPDAPWPSTYKPRVCRTHDEVVIDAVDIYARVLNLWHYESCVNFAKPAPKGMHSIPFDPDEVKRGIVRVSDFRIAVRGQSHDDAYTWLLGEPIPAPDGTVFVIRAYYGDDGGQHTLVVMCDEEYDAAFTRTTGWRIDHVTQHFDGNASIIYSAFDVRQNKAGVPFWSSINNP